MSVNYEVTNVGVREYEYSASAGKRAWAPVWSVVLMHVRGHGDPSAPSGVYLHTTNINE